MKNLLLFLILFVGIEHYSKAQSVNTPPYIPVNVLPESDPNQIFFSVEIPAKFPGGQSKFDDYIKANQKVPQPPAGTIVKVVTQYVIETDGSVSNIKFIKGAPDIYNAEITRLLKESPKWSPGIQNGKPVRSFYKVEIKFGTL